MTSSPCFDLYSAECGESDKGVTIIRREAGAIWASAKLLQQLRHPSASLLHIDIKNTIAELREAADILEKIYGHVTAPEPVSLKDFWTE